MSFTDSSFTRTDNVKEGVGYMNLSEIASSEEITSFGIEYDDDAILAFNPCLRDDIGRYPVANYTPSYYDLDHTVEISESGASHNTGVEVSNSILSNDEDLSSDIEYDRGAIQKFNPDCENDRNRNEAENYSSEGGNHTTDERILACGDMAFGRGHAIERLAAEIVSGIKSKIPQLDKFKQELSQMHKDVKCLKEQYSELDSTYRKASIVQNRTINTAKAYMHNLDLVIYQNRIITHLDDTVKHMKLFECHVTEDRKIIFVDPESPGTDVDAPVHISASQATNLVDKEFKRYRDNREPPEDCF